MKKFTPSHEWIDIQDDKATIGITKYAAKELGEIVFVELPKVGRLVLAGQEASVLESTKAAVDICSPLSGEVVAVNQELLDGTAAINHHPESTGWLYQIRLTNLKELDNLIDEESHEN